MFRLLTLVLLLELSACCGTTTLYDITVKDPTPEPGKEPVKKLDGVPFYPIEQYDNLTNVYYETFFRIDATATIKPSAAAGGKRGKAADAATPTTRTVTLFDSDEADVAKIYVSYLDASNLDIAWARTGLVLTGHLHSSIDPRFSLTPFPPINGAATLLKAKLLGTSRTRIQVPASTPLYYNINIPQGGQASGEIDLNPDGTPGKGLSSKQDSLPGTIATAIGTLGGAALGAPLAQIFSHVFPTPAAPAAAAGRSVAATSNDLLGSDIVKVDLKITPTVRVYTLSLSHRADQSSGCDSWKTSTTSLESTDTCWATVSMAIKGEGSSDEKDPKGITFNGSVTLPNPAKPGAK